MMKVFIGNFSFSSTYEEYIDDILEILETMVLIWNITDDKKLQAIPIILKVDSLSLFSRKSQEIHSYYERFEMLLSWYNSKEKQSRLLSKFQTTLLSKFMMQDHNSSEV